MARELAEKRRVAPGWLDGDVRMLRPENVIGGEGGGGDGEAMEGVLGEGLGQVQAQGQAGEAQGRIAGGSSEGEELDRVFGDMKV